MLWHRYYLVVPSFALRHVHLVIAPWAIYEYQNCLLNETGCYAAKCNNRRKNVVLTQTVIRIAAKCNTKAKCNNIDAKCNKIFNAECNNLSTQIVITFLTHNVITQNVIISE